MNKEQNNYIIVDWAYNVMFDGRTFDDFDSAWEYLEQNIAMGELLEDFVVLEESEVQ